MRRAGRRSLRRTGGYRERVRACTGRVRERARKRKRNRRAGSGPEEPGRGPGRRCAARTRPLGSRGSAVWGAGRQAVRWGRERAQRGAGWWARRRPERQVHHPALGAAPGRDLGTVLRCVAGCCVTGCSAAGYCVLAAGSAPGATLSVLRSCGRGAAADGRGPAGSRRALLPRERCSCRCRPGVGGVLLLSRPVRCVRFLSVPVLSAPGIRPYRGVVRPVLSVPGCFRPANGRRRGPCCPALAVPERLASRPWPGRPAAGRLRGRAPLPLRASAAPRRRSARP